MRQGKTKKDINNNHISKSYTFCTIQTRDVISIQIREKFQHPQTMHCTGLLFLLSSCLLWSLSQAQSTLQDDYRDYYCDTAVNYTANSIYQANLKHLISNLSANAINSNGFYSTTVGQDSNTVYGLFLCRGDTTAEECSQCVQMAGGNITQLCPNESVAIVWYDLCMLRYSNQNIFSTMQESPVTALYNPYSETTDEAQFNETVGGLLNDLVQNATSGSSSPRNFADGSASCGSCFQIIYGLVQCTPDISQNDCNACLSQAEDLIPTYGFDTKQGGRILMPSCNVRFEVYSFYATTAAPSPTATTPPEGQGQSSTKYIIIAVVVAMAAVILVSFISIHIYRRKKPKPKREIDGVTEISMVQSLQFDFDTIRVATADFSNLNKLGQGGFGTVYKGKLLDGQEIAVKRLSKDSVQGEVEFKNEVVIVAKLQHRNLVRLLGFSSLGQEKLLIYEFLPNASLDHFIFDPIKRLQLDWDKRHKIIKGIARGVLYLHEDSQHRIIHRDLKASNVLLDEQMNPKISDFGMARLFVIDQTQNTYRIVGTYGYMAPEYALHGFFSVKSDVFSFGVLLLEIVSGRKCIGSYQSEPTEDLLSYAWRNWREDTVLEVMDTTLRGNCSISEVIRCIHIGLLCVQENVADRPTMVQVDLMFNSSSINLPIPSSPAFVVYNRNGGDKSSSENYSRETETVSSATKSTSRSTPGTSIVELCPR